MLDRAAAAMDESDVDAHVALCAVPEAELFLLNTMWALLCMSMVLMRRVTARSGRAQCLSRVCLATRAREWCHRQRRVHLQRALECHLPEGCTFT